MAYRKYILIILCCTGWLVSRGQSISFQETDSTSMVQYQGGSWSQLIGYGNRVIALGSGFPALHLRMAYAYFSLGNYSAALVHYDALLADDSHNVTARYYSYLCNLYLNRSSNACYQLSYLGEATLKQEKLNPFGLIQAGLETSVKLPGNSLRGNGVYTRASLANRLGWRLQLDQSIAYFGQNIKYHVFGGGFRELQFAIVSSNSVHQFEYYGKLNYALSKNISVWGGYHYLNTRYDESTFNNHIGLLGIKYSRPYFDLQADADVGSVTDATVRQYNVQLTCYPMGNLNLYTVTKASLLHQGSISNGIFSQLLGFKVNKKLWLEAFGTWGTQNNYLEADGLYVYNAIDIIKFKAGSTGFLQLNTHAQLYVNYTLEHKKEYYQSTNYNQHSITAGITWKF